MESPKTVIKKDAGGREIEVRKLKPIDRLRILEIIGADNANNGPYLGYATLAASVTKIDGADVPRITTKIALEAMVSRLDEAGLDAVGQAFREIYPDAATETDAQETLKNG
jgi:hypothetical protein